MPHPLLPIIFYFFALFNARAQAGCTYDIFTNTWTCPPAGNIQRDNTSRPPLVPGKLQR